MRRSAIACTGAFTSRGSGGGGAVPGPKADRDRARRGAHDRRRDIQHRLQAGTSGRPRAGGGSVDAPRNVEVNARDPGGRTITAQNEYRAGAKAVLFDIPLKSGFFRAGRAAAIPSRLVDLNEQSVAGKGNFEVHRIDADKASSDDAAAEPRGRIEHDATGALDRFYGKAPDGTLVAQGKLSWTKAKGASVRLGAKLLGEGVYRLRLKAKDPWGGAIEQAVVFAVANLEGKKDGEPIALGLPPLTIAEHASYVAGETATLLVGSAGAKGPVFLELWGGQFLLERAGSFRRSAEEACASFACR